MAKSDRKKAKELAEKGKTAKQIEKKTGVSKQAAQKFTQKAAASPPPPTTPQWTGGVVQGSQDQRNIDSLLISQGVNPDNATASQRVGAMSQYFGSSFPGADATSAAAAPTTTGGGGGKKKQKKDIADKGLKAQLKIYGADNKIGGKEYKKLTAQGYTPEQIVKRLDVVNQNKGLKIGLGSNVLNKIGKEIAADPFSAISIPGAGNVAARGFGEGKLGQAIKQLAGGTEAPGQRTSPAPAPNQLLKPAPGTVGAGGIQPGQVLRAGGQVGTRQPTRAERVLANQGTIAAAPNVTQPAADMTAGGGGMTAPDTTGGDFGLGDLGVDMGPSASDQALLDAISGLTNAFSDQFGSQAADPYGDLFGDIFGGLDANDPITADILRRYGVGRNYNIDAIRAALRNRMGRRSYLRGSLDSGVNPLRSALSFGPTLGGLPASMGGVGV